MLVLSRQRAEVIMIGDDITITLVDIRGDKVRLGISAPPTVSIYRKEVYDAIQRERDAATPPGLPKVEARPDNSTPTDDSPRCPQCNANSKHVSEIAYRCDRGHDFSVIR